MPAPEQHTEVERKYDVAPDVVVPALHEVPGVATVAQPETHQLEATYFDTVDLRLMAAGITLRRRTGGDDEGWHLKLPGDGDRRLEVRLPLTELQQPPEDLLERVRAYVRDAPVLPVGVVGNRRVVHRLLDEDGATLAELCDDHVTARTCAGEHPEERQWREWELELVTGPPALLDEGESVLVAAGATPSSMVSKARHLLGDRLPETPPPLVGRRKLTAADVLADYLRRHVTALKAHDVRLRAAEGPAGVHQMRIAARRIRSALATYRSLLEPGSVEELREELRWLGRALGEARDAEVMRVRLESLADGQPAELVLGPVGRRIGEELSGLAMSGRAATREALGSQRYLRLLDHLDAVAQDPPFVHDAFTPARRVLPRLLGKELKRVRRRHSAVEAATSATERDRALHDTRKAAKRLRYAAETAEPVFGKNARRLVATAKRLQQLLGEHQDAVVARGALRDIGVRAHLAGENGFTFGRLHGLEEARAARLEEEYPKVLADLPAGKVRRWLEG